MLKARFKKRKVFVQKLTRICFLYLVCPEWKKTFFFPDFFNFSEICIIFAQIYIFWPFSFFKRGSIWREKNLSKIGQWIYISVHKILESQTQISHEKSKFVRGGGTRVSSTLPFSNRDFSHQNLKRC